MHILNIIKCILPVLLAFLCSMASASIRIPSVIGSNMVLQRNSEVIVWGWGDMGSKVSVKAGWLKTEWSAAVGPDGRWSAKLSTGNAGGPYTLTISDQDTVISLENILLGEVWICSGQSNMEFTINMLGGWNQAYPRERDELLSSAITGIRLFTVQKDTSSLVKEDCIGKWLVADTASVALFSATAWFYGMELYKKLGVPVGLIVSAWGGTPAEAWTPKAIVESDPALQFYRSDPNNNEWFPTSPSVLFNAMIWPLLKTSIRGAIWYQGEANVNDAATYPELLQALVKGWRQAWGQGNFPFYFVQIAPFTYERAVVGALLREAQFKSLSIPNSGMAVTMDIADDVTNIHPKNKQAVGKRLALCALSGTYGQNGIVYSGPLYKDFRLEGKNIRLFFEHAEGLTLRSRGKETEFMISGADRHFVPARAYADGNSLLVRSDRVKEPIAVRYAFTNTSQGTLFNDAGLPASTFRTDQWPVITEMVYMKPSYDTASKNIVYELLSANPDATIHYTLDATEPHCSSPLYPVNKIMLKKTGTIYARACIDNIASETIGSWEVKLHKGIAAKVNYTSPFARQYSAGGAYGLVDGVEGSLSFNDGTWQGFEGDDLSVIIDLGQPTLIRKVELHFLADTNSWIFLPKKVEVKISQNGIKYEIGSRFDNVANLMGEPGTMGKQIITIRAPFIKNARYIRIKAVNSGVCPPGHPGAGEKAWLFVDEILVE